MAQHARRTSHGGEQLPGIRRVVGDHDIADALAGQAQRLRPGVAHDGVPVDVGDERHLDAVVHQLPVGLVRDYVDGMAVFCGGVFKYSCNLGQRFRTENYARRVVGRIYYDCLSVLVYCRSERVKVYLEGGHIHADSYEFAAHGFGERFIFGEIWSDGYDLTAFASERLQRGHQRRGGSTSEEEVCRAYTFAKALSEIPGHGLAYGVVSRPACVAVYLDAALSVKHMVDGLIHLFRRRYGRVAQTVVEDVLFAHNFRLLPAVLKHLADV